MSASSPTIERILQVLWIAALVGPLPLVLSPIFADLQQIQSMPVYVFQILVWCISVLALGTLIHSRWDRVTRFPATLLCRLLFGGGIACYLLSVFTFSVSIATVGWILLSGAWMATHGSNDSAKWILLRYWPALCMLLQLPVVLETKLVLAYRQLLAVVVGSIFDILRIPFRSNGLTFEFARTTFSVDETLVNTMSIAWMMFVTCMVIAWLRRPLALLPAYLSAGIFWTFGMHLAQLTVIAFAHQQFELDFSTDWLSIMLTVTNLTGVVVLFLSSDRLLCMLFMPIPLEDAPRGPVNPMVSVWNRLLLPLAVE